MSSGTSLAAKRLESCNAQSRQHGNCQNHSNRHAGAPLPK